MEITRIASDPAPNPQVARATDLGALERLGWLRPRLLDFRN